MDTHRRRSDLSARDRPESDEKDRIPNGFESDSNRSVVCNPMISENGGGDVEFGGGFPVFACEPCFGGGIAPEDCEWESVGGCETCQ